MKIYNVDLIQDGGAGLPPGFSESGRAVGLGFFDGVHRGHQELLRTLVYEAKKAGLKPVVFSFDRYPKQVPPETPLMIADPAKAADAGDNQAYMLQSPLAPSFQKFHGLLQSIADRERIFAELGIEELILQKYNDDFVKVEAGRFMDEILGQHLNAKLIVTGDDYRFGKDRGGNLEVLREWAGQRGTKVLTIPSVLMNDMVVSSSLIREKVAEGEFDTVRALLGRGYTMTGPVIRGKALGRTVGMPTANIRVPDGQVVPPFGVYLTRTRVGEQNYPSVTNIGMRPTVNQTDPHPLIETCLLDVNMNLYDKLVEVEFIRFMRTEEKFPSFLAMTAQIHQDIQDADTLHASLEQPWKYTTVDSSIPIYVRNSERFSECTLDIVFQAPATAERLSLAALTARVLAATAPGYETRNELAAYLDYNYDAMIDVDVFRRGDLAVVNFSCSAVRRGADGSRPFNLISKLLMEMLVSPVRDEDGLLPEHILAVEKKNLLMELRSLESDRDYTSMRDAWRASLDHKDPRTLSDIGEPGFVRDADREGITKLWQELLSEWEMKVYVAGDVQADSLSKLQKIMNRIPASDRRFRQVPGVIPTPFELTKKAEETRHVSGEQAVIVLLYSGLPAYTSLYTLASFMLNMLIGGGPHSRLFEVVREQKALCYSIGSELWTWDSTLAIQARVSREDVPEALETIKDQVAKIARGEFTEREFVSSRLLVEAELLNSGDSLNEMANYIQEAQVSGRDLQVDEMLMALRSMQSEIIPKIAQNMQLVTQYIELPQTDEGGQG